MVKNNIRASVLDRKISQAELSRQLVDAGSDVAMSFISSSKVLPTKTDLAVICRTLECKPTDLYDPEAVDIMGCLDAPKIIPGHQLVLDAIKDMNLDLQTPTNNGKSHLGQVAFRVWLQPEEKKALEIVAAAMGYGNTTEWFRSAYRALLHDAMTLLAAEVPASERPVTAAGLPQVLKSLSHQTNDTAEKEEPQWPYLHQPT